ncbi:hypothetical protein KSP40_PGU010860 [Platanthera guangdongensis]|uniref:Uncharacterized protein n=1 Tax=Platanthera guangdongensis TaxID=2320717 RepID=A0ABR2M1U9_9ASPA
MVVVNSPSQELALTNFAYCCIHDLRKFAIPGSSTTMVLIGDFVVLSLRYPFIDLNLHLHHSVLYPTLYS